MIFDQATNSDAAVLTGPVCKSEGWSPSQSDYRELAAHAKLSANPDGGAGTGEVGSILAGVQLVSDTAVTVANRVDGTKVTSDALQPKVTEAAAAPGTAGDTKVAAGDIKLAGRVSIEDLLAGLKREQEMGPFERAMHNLEKLFAAANADVPPAKVRVPVAMIGVRG